MSIIKIIINFLKEFLPNIKFKKWTGEFIVPSTVKYWQDDGNNFLLLETFFDSQRDNNIDPHKTCYPTSVAVVLRTLEQPLYGGQGREKYLREDSEDILIKHLTDNRKSYQKLNRKILGKWTVGIFPRYIAGFWVWYINNKVDGFKARYKVFTRNELKNHIKEHKKPVVISTKLTRTGHIVVVIGFNKEGFYCNDPYGDASNYKRFKSPEYGKGVFYKNNKMKRKIGCVIITHDK